ncbi:unnamed protein product [Colias eurytheme]|nr:unnamed protein product [Colias eurytheme]
MDAISRTRQRVAVKLVSISDTQIQDYLQNIFYASSDDERRSEDGDASENDDHVSVYSEEEDIISNYEGSDDEDVPLAQLRTKVLRGKNGHVWSSIPPSSSRTPRRNIVTIQRELGVTLRDILNINQETPEEKS